MVYNPPRDGAHKRKSENQHTPEQDRAFMVKRKADLERQHANTPESDKARRHYLSRAITRLDKILNPEKYIKDELTVIDGKPRMVKSEKA